MQLDDGGGDPIRLGVDARVNRPAGAGHIPVERPRDDAHELARAADADEGGAT
jgi:hypothetical protein